jgi:C-5 cytosine-specific DNA methylase
MKPLCIDLFCGLGGWTEGFLSEGYGVVGFDVEQHIYGEHHYPAQLVLQDVRTVHGKQFKNAAIIVASSPCQEFSYRAMPWKRAKALGPPELGMELFAQAKRIQLEACEAAGRYIPMIQENVRGAQKYVGRAQWHYGSYYLWGDVPALMPFTQNGVKVGGITFSGFGEPGYKAVAFNGTAEKRGGWFHENKDHPLRATSAKSPARKAASARIAKIPFPLAQHIAHVYKPT